MRHSLVVAYLDADAEGKIKEIFDVSARMVWVFRCLFIVRTTTATTKEYLLCT
jgi:hypothetical protein